jgi:hypothetical protein
MDFCSLASDEFLNSNILNTFVSGVLAFALIVATVIIARRQSKQQKEIHEQKLLSDRENRIINIYSVFADCGRIFISKYPYVNLMLDMFPGIADGVRRLENYQMLLAKTLDEAKLIFDDDNPLVNQLHTIYNKFYQLSQKEIEFILELKMILPKAKEIFRKEFPDCVINSLQDLNNYPDVLKRFNELFFYSKERELVAEIDSFRKNELSDKNFDDYFKLYINRIPNLKKKTMVK